MKPRRAESSDLGPPSRRANGTAEITDAPDPARPHATIRRARAAWAPNALLGNGSITRGQFAACVRYRDDVELAEGARDGMPAAASATRVDGAAASCPTQAALDALARVRRVNAVLGRQGALVVTQCLVRDWSVRDLARSFGFGERQASGVLCGAIARLAEYYGEGVET